uniref:Uncharacterized protein n=1 Tax=Rhipicephalus zambeziensis TaxID=60191 RepID=A0A224YLE0_9ACAR
MGALARTSAVASPAAATAAAADVGSCTQVQPPGTSCTEAPTSSESDSSGRHSTRLAPLRAMASAVPSRHWTGSSELTRLTGCAPWLASLRMMSVSHKPIALSWSTVGSSARATC